MHDALEMTLCRVGSYWSSFTPKTMVMSSLVAGAEMMTFLTPSERVRRSLPGVGEEASRFDHDVDSSVVPGDVRRVAF